MDPSEYTLGQVIAADTFAAGDIVDVQGVSKGKGFQGVIKRWNQTRGPMGHGSQYHRGVGSLGTMLPMHVIKGKNYQVIWVLQQELFKMKRLLLSIWKTTLS